jgi:sec-independent protein translocase protein TatA
MGSMSIVHWLIVVAVVLLLFGRGKIPELLGDVANGMKSFKKACGTTSPTGLNQPKARRRKSTSTIGFLNP